MPSLATALFTRAMGRKHPRASSSGDEAPLVVSTCCILGVTSGVSFVHAADGVEAASSSAGMPSHATALFTRAMGRKRPRA
eukprot:CAMPEP_0177769372 /NCGR_PEP_ID=MMETSP0491_2-20121128/10279_1 /TAXON_ID=63592 /ORGANISM="Tetraselmis chuii, Strain PLY429" /LENGTH=80 /DNA_ID=CAMNT_0019286361 /DNA_START=57 /DNA_END=298 /DNA_ORIENTATION=-